MGDTVAAQLVGHEPHGFLSLTLQQSAKESPRCTPVPTGLYEDVDQVTVLIHRAPEILALTVDRHEDFVQEPRISESTLSSLQLPSVVGAELPAPLANGFVGHDDSSFRRSSFQTTSTSPANSGSRSDGSFASSSTRSSTRPRITWWKWTCTLRSTPMGTRCLYCGANTSSKCLCPCRSATRPGSGDTRRRTWTGEPPAPAAYGAPTDPSPPQAG